MEIDCHQRVSLISLKHDAAPLKKKVPCDQLQPCMTSELHNLDEDIPVSPECSDSTPSTASSPTHQDT